MSNYTGTENLEVMREAKNYNRYLLKLVSSHADRNERIVDFGAGTGTFALPMMAAGYNVSCVESDPTLARFLESKQLQVYPGLEKFSDGTVDYIYSLNVLEHTIDDHAVIALWYRKLTPGGTLLVYVPAFGVLYSSMDRRVGHYRRYRRRELCQSLQSAGFTVVRSRYADSLGFTATLVYKTLDKGMGQINVRLLKAYDRVVFPLSRALDCLLGSLFGKNLYVLAVKPDFEEYQGYR